MRVVSLIDQVDGAVGAKAVATAAAYGGWGGSLLAFIAKVGSQDVAAGVGVFVALVSVAVHIWHKRAIVKIERAKLTPEQRAIYSKL
jgi:hypothetical protein